MADTSVSIRYLPEPGVTVSGYIKKMFSKSPMKDSMNVTLQAPGVQGSKWYTTRSYPNGKYFFDGLPLYGTQILKIHAANDKAKEKGEIFMDTLFGNPLPLPENFVYNNDTVGRKQFERDAGSRYNVSEKNLYRVLTTVQVVAKKKVIMMRDGPYMDFGYPDDDFTITSADYKYKTLRDFLVQKIPGASYDVERDGVNFSQGGKLVRPRFIVDKREDVFDRLDYYEVPMTQVISVTVRHLIGTPSYERTESESGRIDLGLNVPDVFFVYLQLKPGAYNQDPSKIFTEITGYYAARVFYTPDYETTDKSTPDVRTTIHWAPLVITDASGKTKITFYNADPRTRIRIDVQGITENGIPVVAEKYYDVK